VRREEAPSLYEFRGTRKDGTTVDLEASVSTAKIGGKPYIIAAARDITERKHAEKERSRLAAILESTPDFVGTSDLNGNVLYINRAGRKMLGIGEEEDISGLRIPDTHPQWALEVVQSELFPAILKDGIWSGETAFVSRDGRETPISQLALAHKTPDGEIEFLSTVARDITERKRAESEILLQKARFQQLFENAPLGILRVDQNDIVLDANKEFEDIFQFSLDEMRGRPINEIVVPTARREEGTTLSSRVLQGQIIDQETVRQRKDGTLIPVHVYGLPIVVNQKPVGVFALYVDLSERKRLEEERQAVFEIIQGAISTSDLGDLFKLIHKSISGLLYAENCFVALHDPATDLMHYEFWVDKFDPCPEPRLVGKGFGSHILRTGQPMLLDRELTEEFVRRGEVEKSGTASASWLGVPLRTHSRTIGVLVVQHYEDEHIYAQSDLEFLTSVGSQIALAIERKQAEHALQEANKRALTEYERLIERIAALGQTVGNARDLTIIYRALRDFAAASVPCDGLVVSLYDREKQTRRVVYCWTDNEELSLKSVIEVPVGKGITGKAIRSGTVIIDNNFKPLVGARGRPVLLGEHADNGIPRSALIVPMTVMGRTVGCVEVQSHQFSAYVQEHATAMRMAANLAANAVENVNLIEREQAQEEQLRQSQKMESIGTLAGGIAHDFNNLMTAVTGYSDLALRSLTGDDSLRSKIEEIKKAGERAAVLTRQLLAFSRKQMLQPRVLDLNTVVTGMAQMLPRLIGEHIDLRFRLGDSLGQIKADPGQVEQVLMNLAVNARDAMPEGGVLTIKTENVHFGGKHTKQRLTVEPGNYVMLSVADNGCGMDAETRTHIFEPFFTTKEVGKGTGLGLSTAYGIVKQSGGTLWVYSEVGKGTTFKIYLPRVDVLVESAEIVCETKDAPRGQETVLLVEDDDMVRDLSKEILETYGYSVLVASNGREGLRVGSEFQGGIDLVITDVIMPQMSGREMAEGLRTIRPDTRVLFMSGFTDDAIVHHGVLEERVFFIQKPFSPEALASKAREVLDHVASV
jgi:PAS domain S-box-containing protein